MSVKDTSSHVFIGRVKKERENHEKLTIMMTHENIQTFSIGRQTSL